MIEDEQKIKDWFLVTQGLDITKIIEWKDYLLLIPHGIISKKQDYKTQIVSTILDPRDNNITDISSLKNLTNLTELYLNSNNIKDISSLKDLTNLTHLYLHNNNITDISPLQNLTNLTELDLDNNPNISKEQIQELKLHLSNCRIWHD